jgi:hypothetical protein
MNYTNDQIRVFFKKFNSQIPDFNTRINLKISLGYLEISQRMNLIIKREVNSRLP